MGQYSKYKLYIKEEYDGRNWSPVIPYEYYAEMIEEYSTDCGWVDTSTEYLTFVAKESGYYYFSGSTLNNGVNKISYSLDNGTTWSTPSQEVSINVNSGDTVLWKGNMIPRASESEFATIGIGNFSWSSIIYEDYAPFELKGNVLSLIYGDNFRGQERLPNGFKHAFTNLFMASNVIDASQMSLPCDELTEGVCFGMFSHCSNLIIAPQLPATTLADNCYTDMFAYCTSLVKAPDLLATTVETSYYSSMFYGCSSLNYIKMLATNGSALTYGFPGWVNGVAANGTFVKDANTTIQTGVNGIPNGWTIQNA